MRNNVAAIVLMAVATMGLGQSMAYGGGKQPQRLLPIRVQEDGAAIPVAGGHVALGRGRVAHCEVRGFGVEDGFEYVFELRGRIKLQSDLRTVRRGVLKGVAYWVQRSPSGRKLKKQKIRGRVSGSVTPGETLRWHVKGKELEWSGTFDIGNDTELNALPTQGTGSLLHVDGSGGNDGFAATGYSDPIEKARMSWFEEGTKRRRTLRAVRSADIGSSGGYRGIYTTRWKDTDGRQAGIGVATIGERGAVALLAPDTRVLHDDGNTSVVVDGDNVEISVLSGTPPRFEKGDILVTTLGGGAFGRVRAIARIDERTIIAVLDPVAICDAVEEGTISMGEAQGGAAKKLSVSGGLRHTYRYEETFTTNGGSLIDVAVPTSISLDTQLRWGGEIRNFRVQEMSLSGAVVLNGEVGLTITASGASKLDWEAKVFESVPQPFAVTIGWFPVTGEASWRILARVTGELDAEAEYTTAFRLEDAIELAFTYDQIQGWQRTADLRHSYEFDTPTWELDHASGRIRVELVPILDIKFYKTIGATVEPYAYGELGASITDESGNIYLDWDTEIGFGLDASMYVEYWDRNLVNMRWENVIPEQRVFARDGRHLLRAAPQLPPLPPPADEERVRFILADMQIGGVVGFYRYLSNPSPNDIEAVARWDAGVRLTNANSFRRVIVSGIGWTIVYVGTQTSIDGMDVVLSTD